MASIAIAHQRGDSVAVAVADLSPGEVIEVRILDGSAPFTVPVCDPIPLGHKIALADITSGSDVIEYGERIGRAVRPISVGGHVHVHNVKSARWAT